MKTILIHNNNTALLSASFFDEQYFFQASSLKDVDSYISEEFIDDKLIANLQETELVFIKISLSDNYLEYLGIRLAYHLRLDKRVENKQFAIAFLGEESVHFLCKTYEDYPILLAEGIYKIKDSKEAIESFIEKGTYKRYIEKADFNKFLDKIWLRPPANFESNHSIANEWGICRLTDAIKPDSNENYVKLVTDVSKLTFKNSLYFKYAEAKIDSRQNFRSNNKILINNLGFEDLKVALIDDEYGKGWYNLYQLILNKSKAISYSFTEFSKEHDRRALIDNIKNWIKLEAIGKYECNTFILDLRLHEEDFDKTVLDQELSGIAIYKFIKSLNPGYQIVFVTASNKIWNLGQLDGINARNYIIKENPEFNLTRDNTKVFFTNLHKSLNSCKENLYLIEAHDIKESIRQKCSSPSSGSNVGFLNLVSNKNGLLDKIYICLERGIGNEFDLNQALLYCFHFLEKYCECPNVSENSGTILVVHEYGGKSIQVVSSSGNLLRKTRDLFTFQVPEPDPNKRSYKSLKRLSIREIDKNLGTRKAVEYSGVLYFRENRDQSEVDRVLELLFIRNNLSAHHTGKIQSSYALKPDDIMFMLRLFDEIKF